MHALNAVTSTIVLSDPSVASTLTPATFSGGYADQPNEGGSGDAIGLFHIPLRGRENEAKLLIDVIERISTSSSVEFVQFIGESGCGKTKLVEETLQPYDKCWFVSSKFEELQQRIPFCAAISVFSDLLDLVLQSSEQVLAAVKNQCQKHLSDEEQIILGGLFSSFQYLLGIQEAASLYTPREDEGIAFDRIKKAFKTLLKCIAAVHPVAILWDDLQWADLSTAALLDSLMGQQSGSGGLAHVLFIGNSREAEAGCSPQMEKLFTKKVKLENLSADAILQVISDLTLLPRDEEKARLLCGIIHAKTDGHPYFTVTFIQMMIESDLLWQEDGPNGPRWTFDDDATKIREQTDVSPNIVELLDIKIKTRLSTETYKILTTAAHVGFRFHEKLLVAVVGRPSAEIKRILSTAEGEGFIETLSSATNEFKFAHDSIHQSFYQGDHAHIHLQIAQTIEAQFDGDESVVFAYAEHLNRASSLLNTEENHLRIAKANLNACYLARKRYAIFAAADYLHEGLNVMDHETMWLENEDKTTYQLALELTASSALISYYCGNFTTCNRQLEAVMEDAHCEADKLQVFEILVEVKGAEMEFNDAIKTGITLIRQLGDPFPKNPNFLRLVWIFYKTKRLIGKMTDEEILALPELDPRNRTVSVIVKILGTLCMYGVWTHNVPLISIGAMRMMQLTLKHGQSNLSPYAFCMYGAILIMTPGNRDEAIRFGRLSLRMLERDLSKESEARTLLIAYSCLLHHVEPLQSISDSFEQSCRSGLSTGDIENGLTGAAMQAAADLNSGKKCSIVAVDLRDLCQQVSEELKHENLLRIVRPFWQMAENLMGMSDNPTTLTGEAMDESVMTAEAADNMLLLQYCRLCQLQLCVYFGNFHACPSLIERITKDEASFQLTFNYYFFKFFSALAYASIAIKTGERKAQRGFRKCMQQVRSFDTDGTVNVPPLLKLLEAENIVMLGVQGRDDIERAYQAAIDSAGEMGFCNIQALSCERYAMVLKMQGQREEAIHRYGEASTYYSEFGAEAKVERLQ